MKTLTHDNDDDSWSPIGLAAARVLLNLDEQKNENGDHERSRSAEDEKRALDQAEFVKRGLERIRIFEERAAGVDAPVRKRRI